MSDEQWVVTVQPWPWRPGPDGEPVFRETAATKWDASALVEGALDDASRMSPGVGFLAVWHGEGEAWCEHRPAADEQPEGVARRAASAAYERRMRQAYEPPEGTG